MRKGTREGYMQLHKRIKAELDGEEERKESWQELWRNDQHTLKYLIRAPYDQIPTPSNLTTERRPKLCYVW
jgi:hypothetical protein